jgi:hypothetical protein
LIIVCVMWGSIGLIFVLTFPWVMAITRSEINQSGWRSLLRTQSVLLPPSASLAKDQVCAVAGAVVDQWRASKPSWLQPGVREPLCVVQTGVIQFRISAGLGPNYSLELRTSVNGAMRLRITRTPEYRIAVALTIGTASGLVIGNWPTLATGVLGLLMVLCTDLGGFGGMLSREVALVASGDQSTIGRNQR